MSDRGVIYILSKSGNEKFDLFLLFYNGPISQVCFKLLSSTTKTNIRCKRAQEIPNIMVYMSIQDLCFQLMDFIWVFLSQSTAGH